MSASVWYKEVYEGLVDEIRNNITYNNGVTLDSKQVIVRKPEEDLKFEKYPCVSVYITGANRNLERYDPNLVFVSKDSSTHTTVMEEPHKSFDLSCQIDLWSIYQEDIDEMIMSWQESHYRQFNLEVVDRGGKARTCNCLVKGDINKSDLLNGKERLFHSIINLEIWVELDTETRYNKPMVDSVSINVATE